ncbi:hypothetical protein [Chroococcus sp. FPU101]|uniref:hypothetical protein n=1 Tax=Chroococcus sp. FPU101 TaxID=1974212 RepID=UPI001A8DD40E|nr:hypothetical protein [Chroococcus sp. FPU101]GFE71924.1 hypothetical protein CFPU101_45340 [Chroococcus sp. FPU101]
MGEVTICRIVLSSQLPSYDVESLETALEMASIKIQKQPNRAIGVDDLVVIATVVSGGTATARLVEYGVKVARVINQWRRELREEGLHPNGRLEDSERPPLELSEATDEEIEEWLSRK